MPSSSTSLFTLLLHIARTLCLTLLNVLGRARPKRVRNQILRLRSRTLDGSSGVPWERDEIQRSK